MGYDYWKFLQAIPNNFSFDARNAANTADVPLFVFNTSNVWQFLVAVDMGTNKIANLGAGTSAGDAVNKSQLDAKADTTAAILRDGSQAWLANQPVGGFKFTGLAAGSAAGESVRYEQAVLVNGANPFTAAQSIFGIIQNSDSTAKTLNGTLSLSNTSKTGQLVTGTATGFSVTLPNATTLNNFQLYQIYNPDASAISIKDFSGTTIATIPANYVAYAYLRSNGTSAGTWIIWAQSTDTNFSGGLINYNITSSTTFSTTSATDVQITGFSVTPQSGTYAVWYNASVTIVTNNTLLRSTVYRGGSAITDTIRASQASGGGWSGMASTMTIAQFNGSQACDVRVRSTSGSISVLARSLLLIRIGA